MLKTISKILPLSAPALTYFHISQNTNLDDVVGATAALEGVRGVWLGQMVGGECLSPKISFEQNSSLTLITDSSLAFSTSLSSSV